MSDFLIADNVDKQFAKNTALNKVSISVPKSSIFGLLGPNGAGKTTLIRIINQITAPDEGKIFFDGEELKSKHIAQIGYLPEERGLYKKMKVGEQALYLSRLKGMSKTEAQKKLKYWFEKFEIMSWWDKKIEELSKGMQQKVQFITTVLHQPRLLIFDEPFSGFDPINANRLKKEILELKEQGATIIFSTHNMSSVEELCDHIALINEANKILEGPIDKIRSTYKANIYEIVFSSPFNKAKLAMNPDYELLEINKTDDNYKARIKLVAKLSSNELLRNIMPAGDILSFNEVIPGMNDIFIRVVEESNHKVPENS